ncbi:hypothetical protein GCM10007415_25630 [Parapedobacter pyrenivorans]|uniref:Uncharacterized protein n=1 Tax=Parapedobacter pyrenivorans TaxID=1305674 RepID=A0A917HU14_9SPHI|nr:hypothetical protein [Parapedobacter pyrenivorans]GGG90109.1 hypothetical protein GCM10007415_25630 [Parapedobacter pyrenivorans]
MHAKPVIYDFPIHLRKDESVSSRYLSWFREDIRRLDDTRFLAWLTADIVKQDGHIHWPDNLDQIIGFMLLPLVILGILAISYVYSRKPVPSGRTHYQTTDPYQLAVSGNR